MKAIDISTGKIVEVYESCNEDFPWTDDIGDKVWKTEELIFFETTEKNFDYWTRLKHQYAGMFMKSFLDNFDGTASMEQLTESAIDLANVLIQKLKEKEER